MSFGPVIGAAQSVGQFVSSIPFFGSVDVVGIYTADYTQVLQTARPIKASVKPDSKLMEHPLETGATIIDFRIFMPVEIELFLMLQGPEGADTYSEIMQLWQNATLLTVQTRTKSYTNQLIQAPPYDEDPEMIDAVVVTLKLREVQFANTVDSGIVPQNPLDQSTVNRGTVQAAAPSVAQEAKSSILFDWFLK